MFEPDSTEDAIDRESTPAERQPSAADSSSIASPLPEQATRTRSNVRFIRGWFWRSFAVVGEVAIAFASRELVAHQRPGFAPFITFYPAVLLASLLDGVWAGIAVTGVSTVVAEIWIFPPIGHFGIRDPFDVLSLGIFFAFGISLSIVVELYHRNREKLALYMVEQAVSHEHRRREEERKLAQSIQAERQRLYDVLETLPPMVSLLRPDHRVAFANRSFREKFGPPGDRRCFETRYGRTEPCEDCDTFLPLMTGQPHQREVSFPDDTLMEAFDFPFKDLDGSTLILEMGNDITARRRAEIELKNHREHLEELVAKRTRQLEAANVMLAAEIRELERAQRQVSESRAKLEAALSSMTDSVIITDTDGQFVEFNDAFATLYRFKNKAECARNFSEFTSLFEVCAASGERLADEMFPMRLALRGETGTNVEYAYLRRDTGETWIGSLSFGPVRGEDGAITGAVITARDVTEHKRAERELAEARLQAERTATQLRTIFESVEERLYVCDRDGNAIMANSVARRTYGGPQAAPSVMEMPSLMEVFDLEGRRLALPEWPISRVLRGEHIHSTEVRVRFKAIDQERILSCNGSAIRDQSGEIVMAVLTSADITDRIRTEEALRRSEKMALQREQFQALAERLRRAREEERTKVARDLHDQIGQILTAIKLDLTWMSRRLPKAKDEFHNRMMGAISLINEGVESVRTICTGLRPGVLDDLGLAAAIEWQANEFASRTGICCAVTVPSTDLSLDGDQATEFFRIFQECLTNVMRHAQAKSARVALYEEKGDLVLVVADDGKGFLESDLSDSLGLLGMKERAQVCGGDLEIGSAPGNGTTVTLRVPLHAALSRDKDYAHSDSR
jgi:two-component system, NarL family, sensor histidine kinase UhpB